MDATVTEQIVDATVKVFSWARFRLFFVFSKAWISIERQMLTVIFRAGKAMARFRDKTENL